MKLTNDELMTLSNSNASQEVKEYICKQKMTEEELAICRQLGVSPVNYMIQKSMES